MIKTKKRGQRYPTRRTASTTEKLVENARNAPLGFTDYVLLNVLFDVFCLLQLGLISVMMDHVPGLVFFFIFIMVGFLLVSVFDYVASRQVTDDTATLEATNVSGEAG